MAKTLEQRLEELDAKRDALKQQIRERACADAYVREHHNNYPDRDGLRGDGPRRAGTQDSAVANDAGDDVHPAHIRPTDVFGDKETKTPAELKDDIERILENAGSVIGRNLHFQLDMLHACHVNAPVARKYIDLSSIVDDNGRKPNKNRRNSFDARAQEKFEKVITNLSGESYRSESPIRDVLYLARVWDKLFVDENDYEDVPF